MWDMRLDKYEIMLQSEAATLGNLTDFRSAKKTVEEFTTNWKKNNLYSDEYIGLHCK